jgi:hypothetical protein
MVIGEFKVIKKRIISVVFVYVLMSIGYTQTKLVNQQTLFYLPQGFVLDGLTGYGYQKSTKGTISSILAANPANLLDFDRITVGFSFQFDSKISEAWIAEFGHSRTKSYLPQSFTLVIPFKYLKLGIGVNQLYNSELDYGKFYGTYISDNDQGYIDTGMFHLKREVIIFKKSIALSYCFSNTAGFFNNLSFGIQYNSNYLTHKYNLDLLYSLDSNATSLNKYLSAGNFAAGIRYNFRRSEYSSVIAGIYYESDVDYNSVDKTNDMVFVGHVPAKLNFGIMFEPNIDFNLSGDLSYIFWEDIDTNYRNQLEFALNSCFRLSDNLSVSAGIFHTDRVYRTVDQAFDLSRLTANYLIGGIVYSNDWFSFELALADSRLFSDEWREQFITKAALGFQL